MRVVANKGLTILGPCLELLILSGLKLFQNRIKDFLRQSYVFECLYQQFGKNLIQHILPRHLESDYQPETDTSNLLSNSRYSI